MSIAGSPERCQIAHSESWASLRTLGVRVAERLDERGGRPVVADLAEPLGGDPPLLDRAAPEPLEQRRLLGRRRGGHGDEQGYRELHHEAPPLTPCPAPSA